MIVDAAIIGSELDAFIASIRLRELGYSSNIISNGKGSHLYSPGNIKVLGFDYPKNKNPITKPIFLKLLDKCK